MYPTNTNDAILIADDEAPLRQMLITVLHGEGYEVATAENGRQVLDYLREHRTPQVILLDVDMPEVNGLRALGEIRRHPAWREIPVVLLSGAGEETDVALGMEVGADFYLSKPLDLGALRFLLHRCTQASRDQQHRSRFN